MSSDLLINSNNNNTKELIVRSQRSLVAASALLGVVNHKENARLRLQQEILSKRLDVGEAALCKLKGQFDDQEVRLHDTEETVSYQEEHLSSLERKVERHRRHLDELAKQYEAEMRDQKEMLMNQRLEFGRILMSKLKQDATLDASILFVAWFITKSPLIKFPVDMVSYVSGRVPFAPMRPRERAYIISSLARLFISFLFVRALRKVATKHGFHNDIGHPNVYAAQILNSPFLSNSRNQ